MNSDQLADAVRACAESHRGLLDHVAGVTEEQARAPSLLPGWTVGHILTHLARNADGFSRMVEGAAQGETLAMYADGREGRVAGIAAGAGRPVGELIADLGAATMRLDGLFASCSDETWSGDGVTFAGTTPLVDLPGRRRGEVEIHRVDLGLGYAFADWPADFVRFELARMTAQFSSRKPMGFSDLPVAALALAPADRLAWLLGRLEVDGLPPAGIY